MTSALDILSDERRDALRSALRDAFGTVMPTALTAIGGGASGAFPFKAEIGGRTYLVRVEGPASPLRNPHQYQSMRIAAAAGIAPPIHHLDETRRVAIMDFILERPLRTFPGGDAARAAAVGDLLARVQSTEVFPRFIDYPEMVARLWAWVCGTGLFKPGVLDPCTARLEHLRATYAWDPADSVSSHNDPVPRNILYDGRRLWLIDWESAYRNDPLVDIAIALDTVAPALEPMLLQAARGREPKAAEAERLVQVRAFTRLYYAGVLLSASAATSAALGDDTLATPAVFDKAIAAGSPRAKHILGKMYLASFMSGARPPGLEAAVQESALA